MNHCTLSIITTGLFVGALGLGALVVPAASAATEPVHDTGTIAFVSDRTGNDELYVMTPTGDGVRQLTDSPGFDRAPSWSTDGESLVFNSRREPHTDRPQIYRLDLATGEQRRITNSPIEEQRAAWSADGTAVFLHRGAFLSQSYNIIQHELATGVETNLTGSTDPAIWNAAPAPSPDGSSVLFQSNRDEPAPSGPFPQSIHLLDLATSTITRIPTPASLPEGTSLDGPRWNASGTAFTFSASTDTGSQIFVTQATGDPSSWTAAAVTDGLSGDGAPAFSPDGGSLVFQTSIEGEDPDGEDDTTVIRILDLATQQVRTVGEGRTPVWTGASWALAEISPGAEAPAKTLPDAGAEPSLLVPTLLLAVGGGALLASRCAPNRLRSARSRAGDTP